MNKTKTVNVILTGTYSTYNKGDVAMQLATAQSIVKRWPGANVTISSPFPVLAKKMYKEYRVIRSTRRNLLVGTINLLRAHIYSFLKMFKLDPAFLINNEELNNFSGADIIIDLSGDTLTEDYGPHVTYSHFLPILIGLALKKPVFVCAQSIGPFKVTKLFAKRALNRATKVTARESVTYEYLKVIGIKDDVLDLTSDMAFLLNPSPSSRVNQILSKEGASLNGKINIGISVSKLVEDRFNKNSGSRDNFITSMAGLADSLVERHGAKIVFINHVTGPTDSKDDRVIAKKVASVMRNKDAAVLIKGDYRPDELKGIISRLDLMIGARMHANIGAISSGVPTVALRYSQKTDGIMKLFGQSSYVYDIDNLSFSKLGRGVDRIISNSHKVSQTLHKKLKAVKLASSQNLDIIDRIIKNNRAQDGL